MLADTLVEPRARSALVPVWACLLGVAMFVPLALPDWSGWTTPLLLLVPAVLAVALARTSVLSSAYLFQVCLYFGATSLLLGSHWSAQLVSLVLAWTLAIGAGTLAGAISSPDSVRAIRSWQVLRWPHFVLAIGLVVINAYLALTGRSGYSAQVTLGRSTPTGVLGSLAVAAPVVTLFVFLICICSGRHVRLASAIALAQMFVLAQSGFRGAADIYIVALVIGMALMLPSESPWRRKSRLIVVMPILAALTLLTFIIGADVKNTAATQAHVSSAGTQVFVFNTAVTKTATRLELASNLETALLYRGDQNAQNAVSWKAQLAAGVPRFAWPGKPDADYGQRVSVAMYGLQFGQSSSTVTAIGDCLLNFGPLGVVIVGLILGFGFRRVQVAVHRRGGAATLLVAVVFVYSMIGQESPLILTGVGMLRLWLIAGVLWGSATALARLTSSSSDSSSSS